MSCSEPRRGLAPVAHLAPSGSTSKQGPSFRASLVEQGGTNGTRVSATPAPRHILFIAHPLRPSEMPCACGLSDANHRRLPPQGLDPGSATATSPSGRATRGTATSYSVPLIEVFPATKAGHTTAKRVEHFQSLRCYKDAATPGVGVTSRSTVRQDMTHSWFQLARQHSPPSSKYLFKERLNY